MVETKLFELMYCDAEGTAILVTHIPLNGIAYFTYNHLSGEGNIYGHGGFEWRITYVQYAELCNLFYKESN